SYGYASSKINCLIWCSQCTICDDDTFYRAR
nr:hypothetical protein [Tanacetum cinerariifolium]